MFLPGCVLSLGAGMPWKACPEPSSEAGQRCVAGPVLILREVENKVPWIN